MWLDTQVDSNDFGENLHDHCKVTVVGETKAGLGYFKQDKCWRMLAIGLQYLLTKTGKVITTGVVACAFISSPNGNDQTYQFIA